MPVKKILTINKHEKVLKTPSEPVTKINREIKSLIQDLKDTMADPAIPALGLAAPQIGVHKRVFGIYIGYYEQKEADEDAVTEATIFINPKILAQSKASEVDREGCLSIPGMLGNVPRQRKIKVRYRDEHGHTVEREFENDDARAFQHELDHLDGILFTARLTSLDDLLVYVRDDKGEMILVPYPKVIADAQANTDNTLTPTEQAD